MSSSPFFGSTPVPQMPLESIEMDALNKSSVDPSCRIMEIVLKYEEKYKVFSSINIRSKDHIYHKIRTILSIDLNIEIEWLFQNDYYSFSMILAAFFRQKHALNIPRNKGDEQGMTDLKNDKDFLPECQHPLHTVLVMCYAAHSMQKMILRDDFGQTLKHEKYEQLKEQLEDLACKIVNNFCLNEEGGVQVRKALQADYNSSRNDRKMTPYEEYLYEKFDKSKEIMTVAYKAKAMKFLSQRPCLNLMRIRNECRKLDNSDCESHEKRYKIRMRLNKKQKSWINTNKKLWLHAVFRALYIATFAYMLCKFPVYDDFDWGERQTWIEHIPYGYVISVLIAQVSMTSIKAIDYLSFHGYKTMQSPPTESSTKTKSFFFRFISWIKTNVDLLRPYFKSNKLALWRIGLVVPLLLLEAVQFIIFSVKRNKTLKPDEKFWYGGWVLFPIALELLYCALFAIATVSSLRFFHFVQSLGFFVHLFKKMWKTVGMFVLIFCTFWFVLAVIHVSISRTFMSSKNTIFYTVTSKGKFEIFGEVQDDDRIGNLSECGHFNRTVFDFFDMDYMEASCLFRSSVMPFLVFTYIFVTGILLVNLLTAQLTKEYEKESEKSRYYKGYLKYEQLAKIESKLYLPPPLSLIYISIRLFFAIVTGFCFLVNLLTECCCGKPFWFSDTSRFIYKYIIEQMEGYPWGAVRGSTDQQDSTSHSTEDEIKEFLKKSPDDIWEKLKEVVNMYDRETLDVENLKKLRKDIDDFLDKETEEERERAQSRAVREGRSTSQSTLKKRSSTLPRIQSNEDDPSVEVSLYL